jgi:phage shock protein A
MRILARMRRLFGAQVHSAISRAEHPAKMLDYLVLEMQERLGQARDSVAGAMAAETRLAEQVEESERMATRWHDRARQAAMRGDDELAREALRRQQTALELAANFHRAQVRQRQVAAQLRAELGQAEIRVQEARARRTELLARWDAAQARDRVSQVAGDAGTEVGDAFDRTAERIANADARSQAHAQLGTGALDLRFSEAEGEAKVEDALRNVKREVGLLPAGPEARRLPAREDIDEEPRRAA